MMTFPGELWLVVFHFVIEEAIIRVDDCNYTTFPYIHTLLYAGNQRYRPCDTYVRLRLVCRTFNNLAGSLPRYSSARGEFMAMPEITKSLYIDLINTRVTSLRHPLKCQQLVYLDVSGSFHATQHGATLFDLFHASDVGYFGNVQRLTLRIYNERWTGDAMTFWTHLQRAFPLLVTLVTTIVGLGSCGIKMREGPGEDVNLDRLEILCLGHGVPLWRLTLPRLRHASVEHLSHAGLHVLQRSLRLESLLVRSFTGGGVSFNLGSLPHLKVLGIHEQWQWEVPPFDGGHPWEHLWLFWFPTLELEGKGFDGHRRSFREILKRFPGLSRLTPDLSSTSRRCERATQFQQDKEKLASLGLSLRPPRYDGDPIVEVDCATVVKGGILKNIWTKLRR